MTLCPPKNFLNLAIFDKFPKKHQIKTPTKFYNYWYVLSQLYSDELLLSDDDTSPGPSKRQKLSTTTPGPTSELANR